MERYMYESVANRVVSHDEHDLQCYCHMITLLLHF